MNDPVFSAEAAARFADQDSLSAAEVVWLRAVAATTEARARQDSEAHIAEGSALWGAERAAFLAYMRAPAPDVHAIAGKLLAIERWASDVAQDGGDALLLVEALALVRADVIRLA